MDEPFLALVVGGAPGQAQLVETLRAAGITVVHSSIGSAAVALASQRAPDVVLIDISTAPQDGLRLCRTLKSNPKTTAIPIIFVTAEGGGDEIVRGFDAGGSDCLSQPFQPAELVARVTVHAELRRAQASLRRDNDKIQQVVQELAEANIRLARLSQTDPLTQLLNRRAWSDSARREHERHLRYGYPYSLMMIDVDHFKAFNDTLGHAAGDDCLRGVADCVANGCRSLDVPGRYGGEEFVVLAPDTSTSAGRSLAERVRSAIEKLCIPHPASPTGPGVTVSIGVATVADDGWTDTLKRADDALYDAKRRGRNRVAVWCVPDERPTR